MNLPVMWSVDIREDIINKRDDNCKDSRSLGLSPISSQSLTSVSGQLTMLYCYWGRDRWITHIIQMPFTSRDYMLMTHFLINFYQSDKVDVLYNCIIICIIHGYGKRCTVGYKLLLSRMGAAKFKLVICCVTTYHMVT